MPHTQIERTVPTCRWIRNQNCCAGERENSWGPEPADRATRIMVTLPSSAARDPAWIHEMLERGMNIARINCAHDDADAWRSMADLVRKKAAETGRTCLIAMDIAGLKLRTGPLEPGPISGRTQSCRGRNRPSDKRSGSPDGPKGPTRR